jgi:hypothetical protein
MAYVCCPPLVFVLCETLALVVIVIVIIVVVRAVTIVLPILRRFIVRVVWRHGRDAAIAATTTASPLARAQL